jgi:hypothetical protein
VAVPRKKRGDNHHHPVISLGAVAAKQNAFPNGKAF